MSLYHNAMEERFEEMKLFDHPVLFTPIRIDSETMPKGLYKYEVRDESGEICQIAKGIMVNHWGTIISNKQIRLDSDGYRQIDEEKDMDRFLGVIDIQDYVKKYPIKKQQQER